MAFDIKSAQTGDWKQPPVTKIRETVPVITELGEDIDMDTMKKWNFAISGISAALGAAIIALASKFPIKLGAGDPGAGFWPTILGSILIFLGVILCFKTATNGAKDAEKKVVLNLPANKRVYIAMGIIIIFCAILYFLGFYIGVLFFIPCTMYLMEEHNVKKIAFTTIITLAAIYIVFGVLLKTPLPAPLFLR